MDNKYFDFLCEAFGGNSSAWEHLFDKMEDFELEPHQIVEYTREWASEPIEFNDFMFSCLKLGAQKMKNVLIDYAKDNYDNSDEIIRAIKNYEVPICCDYQDSYYDDDVFNQFSYKGLEDENNQKEMLEMLLDKMRE